MSELNISQRRKARFLAVQALYQWAISQTDLNEVEAQFLRFNDMTKVDVVYLKTLLYEVPRNLASIDEHIDEYTDRTVDKMNPIDLQILRVAVYELKYSLEVPYKVVINEALDLAKTFGADESRRYINGILDSIARKLRRVEIK